MSRILLADDSPHAQRMGERILSDEGYEVVTVSDGDSALIRLEDVDPDLVLADATMPNRSGYEICRYIKISPRHRRTRVLLTAGAHEPFDEEESKRAGADGFLKKPFEASMLLEAVKPLLEAAGAEPRQADRPLPAAAAAIPDDKPLVAVLDPERVRAAVTIALDAAMPSMVDEITEKVLVALKSR